MAAALVLSALIGAVPLIIDTDMSTDVDDVGALCVAHALADGGEATLLAVMHNADVSLGVGAIASINRYYGRDNLPVGAYAGEIGTGATVLAPNGPYIEDLVRRFPGGIANASEAPSATAVYRSALAAAADGSVVIASIGFLTNMLALVRSVPDGASALDGAALVARKVRKVVLMGGTYPKASGFPEWNFGGCGVTNTCSWAKLPASSHYDALGKTTAALLELWPPAVPITFLGFEVGYVVFSGGVLTDGAPEESPCRAAYIDFAGPATDRYSWDPMTVLHAVRGAADGFYKESATGRNVVVNSSGYNEWVAAESERAQQQRQQPRNQTYLLLPAARRRAVGRAIDELLLRRPAARDVRRGMPGHVARVGAVGTAEGAARPGASASSQNTLTLRLLTDAHSAQLGAACLDGSPAGYYFRRGVGPDAANFLVSLVGAGWCTDLASCEARAKSPIGSSRGWAKAVHGYGLANGSSSQNPFARWSVAYVNSCDGAFFLGDQRRGALHFRGRAIVDAVVADLVRSEGLGRARALLVAGDSSGGLAAALSVDRLAAALPAVPRVHALIDGGFFLDRPRCGGDRGSLAPIMALAGVHVSGCGGEWRCASLPHALARIASPLFLTQSLYDYSQLGASGEDLGCTPPDTTASSSLPACDAAGMQRFRAFGVAMRAQLNAAIGGGTRPEARGAFAIGCIAHSLTEYGRYLDGKELPLYDNPNWQVPARSGRTVAHAVAEWYEGRTNATVHIDHAAWPHENSPCAWLGLP